jgi:hypothetical protein
MPFEQMRPKPRRKLIQPKPQNLTQLRNPRLPSQGVISQNLVIKPPSHLHSGPPSKNVNVLNSRNKNRPRQHGPRHNDNGLSHNRINS